MVSFGMVFMFEYAPLVFHLGLWDTGGDLWGIFRAAHYVGWGYLGGVYTPSNGVVTFPGLPVLLAPVAMLSGALHLTESDPMLLVAHPSAALLLEPVVLILTSTVLFAVDALAQRLGVPSRRRMVLTTVVAIIAWPVAAVWGHPEDALAMTFALYATIALLDGKWSRCGWLFGCGIVLQPLVAMMLPLFIAAAPQGRRMAVAVRSAVLSAVLVGVAFAGNPADTYQMLVKQPTQPTINHATPWLAFAPKLPYSHALPGSHVGGGLSIGGVVDGAHRLGYVAGGPGRTIDVLLAIAIGIFVWRRPQRLEQLLWLAAVVLGSRCFFEAVMTTYYVAPALFLALVLAARQGGRRFAAASILALEITVFGYHHLEPWLWWVPMVVGLGAVLALARPGRPAAGRDAAPGQDDGVGREIEVPIGVGAEIPSRAAAPRAIVVAR
jgi:hypothetical protein